MAFTEEEEAALRGILAIYKTQAPALSSDLAEIAPAIYQAWMGDGHAYASGERVSYDGTLYTCLQAHTSQADWSPTAAASLWARTLEAGNADTPTSEVPEWVQPDSTNPYAQGARVKHGGKVWESTVANNVWEPGATGTEALWREVTED
ncbi:carbohydrate-binding protein [Olsenella sp. Marseille-P4559]|uniref:carbohydrate-binding protein n=1 Tax=Olsenella sp. Marseille-P4559 TaxID=2364795 RepID=UPI001031268E|nr:carbohydrate-binding protein [Olsenella sp. Marseille-P4559]